MLAAAVVQEPVGPARAADPPGRTGTDAASSEQARKAEILGSDRWRRAMFELDEWLASQPIYSPRQVRDIKADFSSRVAGMSSYEIDYLLDTLDGKLRVLDSPEARDVREWLGRYLSVMTDRKRADVLRQVPNVIEMSAGELADAIRDAEKKRTAVEKEAAETVRGKREFGEFIAANRRADAALKLRLTRIQIGDAAFSPYRTQPIGEPPLSDASYNSPLIIGVGPWGNFIGANVGAF
jgi:hypothetical protein